MKAFFSSTLYFLLNVASFAQSPVIIADKDSHQTISFANIQMKNADWGTSSDEKGKFMIDDKVREGTLVISAIGYKTTEQSVSGHDTIFLEAAPIQIPDIIIVPSKILFQTKIGSYKKNKKGISFGAGNKQPWMLARYFPYDATYKRTPYLRTITTETRSEIDSAQFMIRLYKKGSDGTPTAFLYDKPIKAFAKKGTNNTVINLVDYDIVFPEEGLFVVMEYLAIESNKHVFEVTDYGSKKSYQTFSYEPRFVTLPSDADNTSMLYQQGKWNSMTKNTDAFMSKDYIGKYNAFAVELTLGN